MRTSIAGAAFLLVGAGAATVAAVDTTGNNIALNGSDTLFDVTQAVISACPTRFGDFTANGITYAGGNLGLGGASLAYDTAGVWGGLTVDAGALSIGTAPLNNTEFYGIRFGAATSGEGISSTRAAGNTQFGLDFFTGRH